MALPSLIKLDFFFFSPNNLQAFAKQGARVTATDINGEKLKELDGVHGKIRRCWPEAAICWTTREMQPGCPHPLTSPCLVLSIRYLWMRFMNDTSWRLLHIRCHIALKWHSFFLFCLTNSLHLKHSRYCNKSSSSRCILFLNILFGNWNKKKNLEQCNGNELFSRITQDNKEL